MKTSKIKFLISFVLLTNFCWSQNYAIQNINVIPMTKDTILKNKTILIKDGIIKSITDKIKTPKNYKVIDGQSKYLIPGLTDMHLHFYQEQYKNNRNTNELELKMMLANGLTTARIMAGHPEYLKARENVKSKTWKGPDLFVASPQLVGKWPWTPTFKNFDILKTTEDASNAVKKFKAQGYDAIKLTFMVKKEIFDAVHETAKRENIAVVGHVGPNVKLPTALKQKMQIEHMDEFIDMLLPDTTYNHGESVSDMNIWRMNAWNTVPHLDESKIKALAEKVKKSGSYITPTNYFFISCFGTPNTDEYYKSLAGFDFIPKELLEERWGIKKHQRDMNLPTEFQNKYVKIRKNMVYELWKAGVPLMAGSDSPEWFLVSGFSIHEELKLFVASGLTPFASLQTATSTPSTYLKTNKGTIEKGKIADLIILDKNPLENIENTKLINSIIKSGVYYDNETLKEILLDVKNGLNK